VDLLSAILLYLSGIFTYAIALRIFGIYTKTLFYKLTYINSLSILKFADNLSMELATAGLEDPDMEEAIKKAYEHWRLLALYSLKVCIPDGVWQDMGTLEWEQAMKMLKTLEQRSKNEAE